jgi:hypothetical protein
MPPLSLYTAARVEASRRGSNSASASSALSGASATRLPKPVRSAVSSSAASRAEGCRNANAPRSGPRKRRTRCPITSIDASSAQ